MSDTPIIDSKNWPNQTYQEWILRTKKELKLDDLSDKVLHIEKNIIYDPYKDYSVKKNLLKIKNYPRMNIGLALRPSGESSFNTQLLNFLSYDLRTIRLKLDRVMDWTMMFNEVQMNMIGWVVDTTDDIAVSLQEYMSKNHREASIVKVNSPSKNSSTLSISFLNDEEQRPHSEELRMAIDQIGKSDLKNVYLEFKISQNLLLTIPFLRAFRIAVESHYPDKNLTIAVFPMIDQFSDKPNQQLIMASSLAMQCSMSGVDYLFPLLPSSSDVSDNQKRLILNIQNIMELESYMHSVKDPLSGSDVIDDLTQQYLNGL